MWLDGVVPRAVETVGVELDAGEVSVRDLLLRGVEGGVQGRADGQARLGRGAADELDDHLMAGQRPAPPVKGDVGEQPVLDLG